MRLNELPVTQKLIELKEYSTGNYCAVSED